MFCLLVWRTRLILLFYAPRFPDLYLCTLGPLLSIVQSHNSRHNDGDGYQGQVAHAGQRDELCGIKETEGQMLWDFTCVMSLQLSSEAESRLWLPGAGRTGEDWFGRHRASVLEDEKVLGMGGYYDHIIIWISLMPQNYLFCVQNCKFYVPCILPQLETSLRTDSSWSQVYLHMIKSILFLWNTSACILTVMCSRRWHIPGTECFCTLQSP